MRVSVTDHIAVSSRQKTKEGYLVAPGVLSRSGIFNYTAKELGLQDREPGAVCRVYRPLNEVLASAGSFENCPITMSHPEGGVTADSWNKWAVGDVHNVSCAGDQLQGTLIVRDSKAIKSIEAGRRHLSCGYDFELVEGAGQTDLGERFDFQQRGITGNHLSVVDSPRCGPQCRIGDSDSDSDDSYTMGADAVPNNTLIREKKPMQLIIDGAIYSVADEGLAAAIKGLQAKVTVLEKQSHDFGTAVADRSRVTHQIANLGLPGFQITDSMDANAARRSALEKLLNTHSTSSGIAKIVGSGLRGRSVGDATDEELQVLFDSAVAAAEHERKNAGLPLARWARMF